MFIVNLHSFDRHKAKIVHSNKKSHKKQNAKISAKLRFQAKIIHTLRIFFIWYNLFSLQYPSFCLFLLTASVLHQVIKRSEISRDTLQTQGPERVEFNCRLCTEKFWVLLNISRFYRRRYVMRQMEGSDWSAPLLIRGYIYKNSVKTGLRKPIFTAGCKMEGSDWSVNF